jgi:YHS domain-containing protein
MKHRRRLIISIIVLLGLSMLVFGQAKNSNPKAEKARDPVCGIMVEKDPQLAAEYKGKTYYFCSRTDKDKFKQNPQKYVKVLAAVKEWDTLADQKGPVRHELMAVRCRPARKVDRVFQAVSS